MNDLLNRLFGLGADHESIGFGSPDAHFTFVHPLASWIIALLIGAIVLLVWWSYRAVPSSRLTRSSLATCRALALVILFLVAMGPMIEQSTAHTEKDWVLVLLDRSGSLTTPDAPLNTNTTQTHPPLGTRDAQLKAMLGSASEPWNRLANEKHILWMGFGDVAKTLATGTIPDEQAIGKPISQRTNLARALASALDQAAARPISSVVIVSDGRSFEPIEPEQINTLKSAQIPIFAIPLGSDGPVRDLGIVRVEHPQAVFGDDLVPIRVRLSASSISSEEITRGNLRIELIDHARAEVLDSAAIEPKHLGLGEEPNEWITLNDTPAGAGDRQYDLVIRSDSGLMELDLDRSNNRSSIRLRVVDRPMRVLYIDGYPRWEYRYLKNLLLRERSIVSSSMLLAASRRYVQEGDELIGALPATIEDWEPFDVILLGDVRPELFSDRQLESLLEHITKHGAGMLWIAGPSANPIAWLDSPLGVLLPMRSDAGGSQGTIRPWDSPVTMRSTDEAIRLGLLGLDDQRAGWFDRLSDPATGWSKLQWALRLDETTFKPSVSILARAQSAGEPQSQSSPIITMMRYGAGQTMFVGTDEIWRWRYGRGEDLTERFWLPLIRSLGRGTVDRRSAWAALRISPTNPIPGNPARITLELFDQAQIDSMPEEVRIELRAGSQIDEHGTLTLRGTGDTRIGTWIPARPGIYTASPIGLDPELAPIRARVQVLDHSAEQRLLDTDHQLLAELAQQTGGELIPPGDFGTIPERTPNRARTILSPPQRTSLWDRPIVLIVLVLALTGEWIARRALRLA